MKRVPLLLLSLCMGMSDAAELTIKQAIETAKKHRPNIQALEYKIMEEKLKVKEAWSGYRPQVQLTSGLETSNSSLAVLEEGNTLTSPSATTYGLASVQAQQLLYQFGGPQQQAKIARAGVAVAQYDKATQEANLAYEVSKTCIDAWVIQQQQALFNQLELSSNRIFNRAQKQHDIELLDKQDFFGSVENRAFAHEQAEAFKEDAALVETQLTFLLGDKNQINLVDETKGPVTMVAFTPQTPTTTTPICHPGLRAWTQSPFISGSTPSLGQHKENKTSINDYITKAMHNRPELKQMDNRIDLEKQAAKLERLSTGPKLSVGGSAGNNSSFTASQRGQYTVGLYLNWSIFDGDRAHYRQQEADARAIGAMLQKEQLVQQIRLEVEQAYRMVSRSTLTYKSQQIAFTRAQSLFARRQQELKLGIITKTNLEESRYGLLQAKNRWILAQADYAQKHTLLQYRCGEIA